MAKSLKTAGFWLLGSICIFMAVVIIGQTIENLDALSLIISFLLILFGGLLWISVAASSKSE